MRQELLDLYAVQQIDVGIRDLEKRRGELPARLEELESALTTAKAEMGGLEVQREEVVKEIKTLQATVETETNRLKKWERRLADLKNQREYLALSREVEGAKRANRQADERIVELNATRSDLEQKIAAVSEKISELCAEQESEKAKVDAAVVELVAQIAAETERRDGLLHTVPKPLLRTYEFVRQKRAGVGIVPVVGGYCQGCNMRLPPQLFNTLQRVTSVEQCPSCQRIVFWEGILEKRSLEAELAAGAAP